MKRTLTLLVVVLLSPSLLIGAEAVRADTTLPDAEAYCYVYRTTQQGIKSNKRTAVRFAPVKKGGDEHKMFTSTDPTVLTSPGDTVYTVTVQASWSMSNRGYRELAIQEHNGRTGWKDRVVVNQNAVIDAYTKMETTSSFSVDAGTRIRMVVKHNAGRTLYLRANDYGTKMVAVGHRPQY